MDAAVVDAVTKIKNLLMPTERCTRSVDIPFGKEIIVLSDKRTKWQLADTDGNVIATAHSALPEALKTFWKKTLATPKQSGGNCKYCGKMCMNAGSLANHTSACRRAVDDSGLVVGGTVMVRALSNEQGLAIDTAMDTMRAALDNPLESHV